MMQTKFQPLRTARSLAVVAALTVAAGLAVSACGGSSDSDSGGDSDEPIKVGSVLDLTGPLNIYGKPKIQATKLAIEDINANGGVLGRQLELVSYDSQSSVDKNVQYSNTLATEDEVAVVMGGVTSASREAMRPVLSRNQTLYFYNNLYEGGVCDRNIVINGTTASQHLAPLIPYAIEEFGPRLYVVAADYNYGRISAEWVKRYAAENGGEVVKEDFIPLDSSNFQSVIGDIQRLKPDVVVSILVGANHIPFYRQFKSTGLSDEIPIVSPSFGVGNEHEILDPASAEGIIVGYSYFEELDNPTNEEFLDKFNAEYGTDHPYITDLAVSDWDAWHLWAAAVEEAGSLDREKVLDVIETGDVSFESPSGPVHIDGPTHQLVEDVTLAKVTDKQTFEPMRTFEQSEPTFEQEVCDLVSNPTENKAFTP
jgi:urea transport system substrate-binding protein